MARKLFFLLKAAGIVNFATFNIMLTKPLAIISPKKEVKIHLIKIASYFILCFFILVWSTTAAQSFQTIHNLGYEDEAIEVIELSNNRYLIAGAISSSSDNWFPYYDNAFVAIADSMGAIISTKPIPNFYPRGMFLLSDTIIIAGNQMMTPSGYFGIAIHQLDTALNVLRSSVYAPNNFAVFSGVPCIDYNKKAMKYAIFKINVNTNRLSSVLFNYNIIQNTYTSLVYDSTLYGLPITNFISQNKTLVYQFISSGQGSYPGLVTINNSGQVLSSKRVNTGIRNYFMQPDTIFLSISVEILKYQNYFFLQGEVKNPNANTVLLSGSQEEDYALIVLDSNLNRIGVSIIGSPDSADAPAYKGMVFKNNRLFIGGTKNWWFDDYYKPEASFIRISEHNLNGSFIQERFYSTGKFIILNSIKGTKDGGFILVGSSYDSLGAHQNGLDLFIMKLDSLGNLTGINGKKASKLSALDFAVYPNPASEFVTFQKINQFQEYHLQVVNLLGNEIYNSFWQNDKLNIDLSQYKAGLYLYRITDNTGAVFQGKFIKK